MREDRIQAALDACYDAVITPTAWASALQNLASTVDAAAMMFYPLELRMDASDPRNPDHVLSQAPMATGYQELIDEYERGAWYLDHYRAQRGLPLMKAGQHVVIEHQLATDEERRRSRHYNELYLRFGFAGYAMVNIPMVDQAWCVPMVRSTAQGHFSAEDAGHLRRLIPHFRRLISLSGKLSVERGLAASAGLEVIRFPAALIDWHGGVRSINAPLHKLLGQGIDLVRGHLSAADSASDKALRNLIRNALSVERSAIGASRATAVLARPFRRPLLVEALPLSGLFHEIFSHSLVLLLVTDLDGRPTLPDGRLKEVFGLTFAEARLASHLLGGTDLKEAADTLGITYETARSQLRSIFSKTGTTRQVDLVLLLNRLTNR